MYLYWDSGGGYSGNQENRYVGFGNTVTPEKKEDDFINNAMSSIYSVGRDVFNYCHSVLFFSPFVCLFLRVGAVLRLELASLRPSPKTM